MRLEYQMTQTSSSEAPREAVSSILELILSHLFICVVFSYLFMYYLSHNNKTMGRPYEPRVLSFNCCSVYDEASSN